MKTSDFIEMCPSCSSTECVENYPVPGKGICFKCGHESVRIKLQILEEPNVCHYCGEEVEKDAFLENNDILILKCRKCGKFEGYKFPDSDFVGYYDAPTDNSYGPLTVKIANQEGRHAYSATRYQEFAKALRKREKSPIEKCKKQLSLLIYEKKQDLKTTGISNGTIRRAKWEARSFIERKGPLTEKQLQSLFPAALYIAQEFEQICYGKTSAKKVTERQLEKTFNVTRKTIRKWKKILQKAHTPLKIRVLTRQTEGQPKYMNVEIPAKVDSLLKLEEPYEDQCDFCEQHKLLCWRLRYVGGSWSDICDDSYRSFELSLKEQQIWQGEQEIIQKLKTKSRVRGKTS